MSLYSQKGQSQGLNRWVQLTLEPTFLPPNDTTACLLRPLFPHLMNEGEGNVHLMGACEAQR